MKKLICYLVVIVLFVQTLYIPIYAKDGISSENLVEQYVKSVFDEVCETVVSYRSDFGLCNNELKNLSLCDKYVICDLDRKYQDEIFYYPIKNSYGYIIVVLCIMGTDEGLSYSISTDLVEKLNYINYQNEKYSFFESDDSVIAISDDVTYNLNGHTNRNLMEVKLLEKEEVEEEINYTIENYRKADFSENIYEENVVYEYAPSFSESTRNRKICSLYNPQSQYNYKLCWAATVATIVNYRRGTNISCTDVAKKMGQKPSNYHGESDGVAWNALGAYDVIYNNLNLDPSNKMNWNNYILNINNKYPVYVGAMTADNKSGHAVTAYGYRTVSNVEYISIWNSGTNNCAAIPFKASGSTFVYNNKTFKWQTSISVY